MNFDRAFRILDELEDQCYTCIAMGELRAELIDLEEKYRRDK